MQVHLAADGAVWLFSKNCDDFSGAFPDVADAVRRAVGAEHRPCVLDGEIVAVGEWDMDIMHVYCI